MNNNLTLIKIKGKGGTNMILNVSGRTDIVAFYSKWFMNCYKEGFVDVRNPFNPHLISRINFQNVDAILFCTKNPKPIIPHLKSITHPIIFQVTLTPYKQDVEPNVPSKKELIDSIKKISEIVGIENLFIRYDPILLNDFYNLDYHKKAFEKICTLLDGHVKTIIVSFIDDYKNVRKNMNVLKCRDFKEKDYEEIGKHFSKVASNHGMTVQTCFEDRNLTEYGFIKNDCISHEYAFKLTGKTFKTWTARKEKKCNCVQLVDIGDYNSCSHFCKYCYANYNEKLVQNNVKNHNPNSSLLIGSINPEDTIKERFK